MGNDGLTRERVERHLLGRSDIRKRGLGLELVNNEDSTFNPYINVIDTESTDDNGFAKRSIPLRLDLHLTYSLGPLGKSLIGKMFEGEEGIVINWAKEEEMRSTWISYNPESLDDVDRTLSLAKGVHKLLDSEKYDEANRKYYTNTRKCSDDLVKGLLLENKVVAQGSSR